MVVQMAHVKSSSIRFQDDVEAAKPTTCKSDSLLKHRNNIDETKTKSLSKVSPESSLKTFDFKVVSRVFAEDYEPTKLVIFDPHGPIIRRWKKIFFAACLLSLFVDPLFFYLPRTQALECIDIKGGLAVGLTIVRSLVDVFYTTQIFVRFRTASIAPSSRVFGRGELVIDPLKISYNYLSKGFWLDLVAALPIPQFFIWIAAPNLNDAMIVETKIAFLLSIMFQYLPRLFLIFPLSCEIAETTGVMTETAWAGAAYNLLLYILASHVIGASWYLLSIERQESCWREACSLQSPSCHYQYFECQNINNSRDKWFQSSNLTDLCNPSKSFYQFGIYGEAVTNEVTSSPFFQKSFYSFFWGLKNLSCLGQNLVTSTYIGENIFAIVVGILGLVLFGLLIGNVQSYLESTTTRLEEWRIRRTDTEQWMHHRQLPSDLKQRVRRYDQCRWIAMQGVDEDSLIKDLPFDLRRDIKRHLCLDLVLRVPLFEQMDEQMLDAICERLRPALYTEDTYLVRELDPVNEMLFIVRGALDSYTTNGGRTGFFNSCRIGPGDFCGEELLPWALDPRPTASASASLPCSTRSVRAVSEVEGFALVADDLMFVAAQFRRLHSKRLQHTFRSHSQQWRAWAACFIQAAWRRHRRRRKAVELTVKEAAMVESSCTNARGGGGGGGGGEAAGFGGRVSMWFKKPTEPYFSVMENER